VVRIVPKDNAVPFLVEEASESRVNLFEVTHRITDSVRTVSAFRLGSLLPRAFCMFWPIDQARPMSDCVRMSFLVEEAFECRVDLVQVAHR
jgi:hypothetical protein